MHFDRGSHGGGMPRVERRFEPGVVHAVSSGCSSSSRGAEGENGRWGGRPRKASSCGEISVRAGGVRGGECGVGQHRAPFCGARFYFEGNASGGSEVVALSGGPQGGRGEGDGPGPGGEDCGGFDFGPGGGRRRDAGGVTGRIRQFATGRRLIRARRVG
ncbi:MAG: hypothetical protein FJ404_13520 [Verrucomicrobia bacterium]|nr:hypothetical protein [Verrucomicrobiota bacterium]